ncbi:hypothetical protein ACOTHJ_12695 [Achromobacter xylosoxidans]
MSHKIEVQVFDTPSGTVRGIATCFMQIGNKDIRVAHAMFLVNEPTAISLEVPKRKIALADVVLVTEALKEFHDTIKDI